MFTPVQFTDVARISAVAVSCASNTDLQRDAGSEPITVVAMPMYARTARRLSPRGSGAALG